VTYVEIFVDHIWMEKVEWVDVKGKTGMLAASAGG